MRTFLAGIAAAFLSSAPAFATSVGISMVEQPVNLGTKSDPSRIPLGRVGVVSNYNYGIHEMIAAPRPCPDGAMRWDGGSELDQNLASVFGISVEPEDPTQISAFPVILRMKPWKAPAYSPYSKEQALAATLWCLLRSAGGTPENPLDVRVVAEGPEDKALEAKYSGKYVTRRDENGSVTEPPKVPGTEIEEDARGIAWVRFPEIKDGTPPPTPAMILLNTAREDATEWFLLPVWGNGANESDFLRLTHWQTPLLYSAYQSTGVTGANAFLSKGGAVKMEIERGESADSVTFAYPRVDQTTLAAQILALVVSAQPTEERPLTVTLLLEDTNLAPYLAFRNAADWVETANGNPRGTVSISGSFVWDTAVNRLAKGSIPLVEMKDLGLITQLAETTADDKAPVLSPPETTPPPSLDSELPASH